MFARKVILLLLGTLALLSPAWLVRQFLPVGAGELNYGIAFGLVLPAFALWLLFPLVLIFVLHAYFWGRTRSAWGFYLIAIGGFSNLAERLLSGGVFDYLNVPGLPAFNLADLTLSLGVIFLILKNLNESPPQNKRAAGS